MTARRFDIYGLRLAIDGSWEPVVEALRRDFAWFEVEGSEGDEADARIHVEHGAPDLAPFGDVAASFVTERNVVYHVAGDTVIDYLGLALSVIGEADDARVTGTDEAVARRAGFDFALAQVSKHLDGLSMPRLHGLGLVGAAGAVVIVLPSGGGKTTLALRALREDGIGFLSEGSPIIDGGGRLHPLPFPLWVRDRSPEAAALPLEHVRRVAGELSDPRILEVEAFEDKIARGPHPLAHIVLGRRSLGLQADLRPLPRRAAVPSLVRDTVVGFGFFQGAEFLLRHGLRDLRHRVGPMSTRARACAAGLRHARVWELTVGRDREANWAALAQLLR